MFPRKNAFDADRDDRALMGGPGAGGATAGARADRVLSSSRALAPRTLVFDPLRGDTPDVDPIALAERVVFRLWSDGFANARAIETARREATGKLRLDQALVRLGLVDETDVAQALSDEIGAALADPRDFPEEPVLPDLLPARFLSEARALPLDDDGETLKLAMADPLDDYALRAIAMKTKRRLDVVVAAAGDVKLALASLYPSEAPRVSMAAPPRLEAPRAKAAPTMPRGAFEDGLDPTFDQSARRDRRGDPQARGIDGDQRSDAQRGERPRRDDLREDNRIDQNRFDHDRFDHDRFDHDRFDHDRFDHDRFETRRVGDDRPNHANFDDAGFDDAGFDDDPEDRDRFNRDRFDADAREDRAAAEAGADVVRVRPIRATRASAMDMAGEPHRGDDEAGEDGPDAFAQAIASARRSRVSSAKGGNGAEDDVWDDASRGAEPIERSTDARATARNDRVDERQAREDRARAMRDQERRHRASRAYSAAQENGLDAADDREDAQPETAAEAMNGYGREAVEQRPFDQDHQDHRGPAAAAERDAGEIALASADPDRLRTQPPRFVRPKRVTRTNRLAGETAQDRKARRERAAERRFAHTLGENWSALTGGQNRVDDAEIVADTGPNEARAQARRPASAKRRAREAAPPAVIATPEAAERTGSNRARSDAADPGRRETRRRDETADGLRTERPSRTDAPAAADVPRDRESDRTRDRQVDRSEWRAAQARLKNSANRRFVMDEVRRSLRGGGDMREIHPFAPADLSGGVDHDQGGGHNGGGHNGGVDDAPRADAVEPKSAPRPRRIDHRLSPPTADQREMDAEIAFDGAAAPRLMAPEGLLRLDAAGFNDTVRNAIEAALAGEDGLILVCGPSGSGKSSTLAAVAEAARRQGRDVRRLDDPDQPAFPPRGDAAAPANGARTVLVGDIRSPDLADAAARAAITGALVIATLDAPSAAAAPPRLVALGVPAYVLASCLRVAVAQHMAPRICARCAGTGRSTNGAVCGECNGRRRVGEIAVVEALSLDDATRALILAHAPEAAIRAAMTASRAPSLADDAAEKVAAGLLEAKDAARAASASAQH